jgi:hypothetical protein
MKKAIVVGVFAIFGVIALSSCKKDRTCTCTINGGSATSYTIEGKTRSEAKTECDSGDGQILGIVVECSLN